MQFIRKLVLSAFILGFSFSLSGRDMPGQDSNLWSFGAEGGVRHVIDVLHIHDNLIGSFDTGSFALVAARTTSPADSCRWAYGFNYPTLSLGLMYSPYGILKARENSTNPGTLNDGLGSMLSLFAGAEFFLFRSRWFSTGPYVRAGLAYADRIYNPVSNPDNQYVGTPLEGYFALGWQAGIMASEHCEVTLSAGFNHHSCGKMFLPNWGVTDFAANLGLRYHLSEPFRGHRSNIRRPSLPENLYRKGLNWAVYASSGLHSCETLWEAEGHGRQTEPCVRAIIGADMSFRYSPFLSSGIGLEGGWSSGVDRLREAEAILHPEEKHNISPCWAGLGIIQSVHYRNFSAHIRIGWYLYRQLGRNESDYTSPCYQKVGFRYRFNRSPLFVGFDMKTHKFDSSDCLELSAGVSF